MKKLLRVIILLVIIINGAQAQTVKAPAFTYAGPQSYTAGTAITTLSPVSTGGVVPGVLFGQTATIVALSNNSVGMVVDTAHNIYFSDMSSHIISKITPNGVVSRFAGNGNPALVNGTGTAASFNSPEGLAIDAAGYIYVADAANNVIRKISPYGVVTTLAGNVNAGSLNGTGTAASFSSPSSVVVDKSGNVFVTDAGNNLIRKITAAGVVSTFAGSGSGNYIDGTGTAAGFSNPSDIAIDAAGNLYVNDLGNQVIRKITAAGVVTTLAGTPGSTGVVNGTGSAASFNYPAGIAVDVAGNVYVADKFNNLVRKITPAGVVTTLAGGGQNGDGIGTVAGFSNPQGLASDASGNVYLSDVGTFRKISSVGYISPNLPAGLSFDPATGNISGTPLLAVAAANYTVTGYNVTGSAVATLNIAVTGTIKVTAPATKAPILSYATPKSYPAGTAIVTSSPTNTGGAVPGVLYGQTSTFIYMPNTFTGLVTDASGNIYTADVYANVIRKVTPAGAFYSVGGFRYGGFGKRYGCFGKF